MLWLGVAGFTLVDSAVSPKFSAFGLSLLLVAVLGRDPVSLSMYI